MESMTYLYLCTKAGMFLEDLLGLTAGSADIPDARGWELKMAQR